MIKYLEATELRILSRFHIASQHSTPKLDLNLKTQLQLT
uniref:Uncharacterized protein n=1 Tax=Arundo donax TaxID=35708 RepID=A0A0A8ZT11_ARUDO